VSLIVEAALEGDLGERTALTHELQGRLQPHDPRQRFRRQPDIVAEVALELTQAGAGLRRESVNRRPASTPDNRADDSLDRRLRRGERTLQSIDEAVSRFCGFANKCADLARKPARPTSPDPNTTADPAATIPPGALS